MRSRILSASRLISRIAASSLHNKRRPHQRTRPVKRVPPTYSSPKHGTKSSRRSRKRSAGTSRAQLNSVDDEIQAGLLRPGPNGRWPDRSFTSTWHTSQKSRMIMPSLISRPHYLVNDGFIRRDGHVVPMSAELILPALD